VRLKARMRHVDQGAAASTTTRSMEPELQAAGVGLREEDRGADQVQDIAQESGLVVAADGERNGDAHLRSALSYEDLEADTPQSASGRLKAAEHGDRIVFIGAPRALLPASDC